MQSLPVTVTEIHEAISKRMHLKVSRKTIERDMIEMAEVNSVSVIPGVPSKYTLNKPTDIEIVLKEDEVKQILQVLNPGSDLYIKLNKTISP